MRIWRALVCLERKLMPLGLSRVLFVLDKSALKKLWTPMRSSGGFVNFLELKNGQHNGWPCAHFGSPTRFRRLTVILRTRSIWGVRVNLKNTRWLGGPGELTRQSISGLSPAKSSSGPACLSRTVPVIERSKTSGLHPVDVERSLGMINFVLWPFPY